MIDLVGIGTLLTGTGTMLTAVGTRRVHRSVKKVHDCLDDVSASIDTHEDRTIGEMAAAAEPHHRVTPPDARKIGP